MTIADALAEIAAMTGHGTADFLQRGQTPQVVIDRLVCGEDTSGLVARPGRVGDRLVRVVALTVVVSKRLVELLQLICMRLFQIRSDSVVQGATPREQKAVVRDLLDQGVFELVGRLWEAPLWMD